MPPVIHGDDEQTRVFTYIEDVVRANILAAENEAEGVYNIGNGKNTTINQLADIILKLMKKDSRQSMTNRDLEIQGILWWIYLKR